MFTEERGAMQPSGKGVVHAQGVEVSPVSQHGPSPASVLKNGDRVAFRVLEALPGNRYRIQVRQHQMGVHSRIPLEEQGRYLAEVRIRQGVVHFLSKPLPANAMEALLSQRQVLQTPLSSLLRILSVTTPLPQGFSTDCRTAEAVRTAFLNCGMFYEARVREALRKRGICPLFGDLKSFLLQEASKEQTLSVRETIASALKQLELQQFLALQSGPEGPFSFWLPFGDRMIIEGFVKRFRNPKGTEFLLTLRVPFLPSEELLVTVAWKSARVEVDFATGPSAYPALRRAAHSLEERLVDLGICQVTVRVSRGVPKHLRRELEGIRFVESYG
jgi:hypothetical protein